MSYEAKKFVDDESDLEQRLRLSTILQASSPAVAAGSDYPEVRPGDFQLAFEDGSERHVPRTQGVVFIPVACVALAVEWPADRSARGAPIDHHDVVPLDAKWGEDSNGRKACRRPNGNRIEKTIYIHIQVGGLNTTFAIKAGAYSIAQDFARDADRIRVNVDGEVVRVAGALWKMTSELERQDGYSWFAPRFEKVAILGQLNGPSIDLVRVAKAARFEFKIEEAKRKAERASLSAVTPTPRLVGSTTFTSGVERPHQWSDPKPTSADPADGLPF